jgi:two-component system sensor histidine kinase BarA
MQRAARMHGDMNFTKIARLQIATLRKWRVPDARAA